MRKSLVFVCCLILQFGVLHSATDTSGLFRKRKKKQVESTVVKLTDYEKLMNKPGRKTSEGMFTLHTAEGKLFVEIPLKLMGRDILVGSTISEISDNNVGSVGEKTSAPFMVRFALQDSTVYLNSVKDFTVARADTNTRKALNLSSVAPILEKYKLQAYNKDSSAVVIDMTDYFVSDNDQMSPISSFSGYTLSNGKVTKVFQKDKSKLETVRAFEDNVSIKSRLSYKINVNVQGKPYLKDVPFVAVMTRSLLLLPEKPLGFRYMDSRINVFSGGLNELSSTKGFEQKYVALRWRMEPVDEEAYARGELVEPKKPIVFYIDNNFPENWKPAIKKAVEVWQKPFEKIGFKNAIVAKDFPKDDPNFDPENLKYSCIRYVPSRISNAMGPSWTDPRSGEIINAAVYVYHNVVQLLQSWRLVQTAQADEQMRTVKFKQELLEDCLGYVLSHEIGHCLSFSHNMSASAAIPVDSLRSPSFTQQYGTTYSIMDYARNNYVAQPGDKERGVRLTPPELGVFDYFAIKWLYTYFPKSESAEAEAEILKKWLDEKSGDPVYRYGWQQDPKDPLDPTRIEEDLGDDAIKASIYGIKNLKYITAHLNEWFAADDPDGEFRRMVFSNILGQYNTYIRNVIVNAGGVIQYAHYEGDQWPSYKIVPREKQMESVKFLLEQLKDLDWLFDSKVLTFMPASSDMKAQFEDGLFSMAYLARMGHIRSAAARSADKKIPAYTLGDHVKVVSDFVWEPTRLGRSLTTLERKLQVDFVTKMALGAGVVAPFKAQPMAAASTLTIVPGVEIPSDELFSHDYGISSVMVMNKGAGVDERDVEYLPTALYSELQNAQTLLRNKVNTGNAATRDHYRLLLFRLEQVLIK